MSTQACSASAMDDGAFVALVANESVTFGDDPANCNVSDDPWHGLPVCEYSGRSSSAASALEQTHGAVASAPRTTAVTQIPARLDFFDPATHLWLLNFSDFEDISCAEVPSNTGGQSTSCNRGNRPYYCGLPVTRIAGMASLREAVPGNWESWQLDLDDDTAVVRCYLPRDLAERMRDSSDAVTSKPLVGSPGSPGSPEEHTTPDSSSTATSPFPLEAGVRVFFLGRPIWTKGGFRLALNSVRPLVDFNEEALFRGIQVELQKTLYFDLKRAWLRELAAVQLDALVRMSRESGKSITREHVELALKTALLGKEL